MVGTGRSGRRGTNSIDRTKADGLPVCPESASPAVKTKFAELVSMLPESSLRRIDCFELRILADLLVQSDAMAEAIAADPVNGGLARARCTVVNAIHKLAAGYGLNIADRLRMALDPDEGDGEMTIEEFNRWQVGE